jgi:hypothetical protein
MKSPCTSPKHSEYTCLIKWGVSSKKFSVDKWCEGCTGHYEHTPLVQNYVPENEPKKRKKPKQ